MNFETFLHTPNENKPLFRDTKPGYIKKPRKDEEYQECKVFKQWLDTQGFFYSHIANESYTGNAGVLGKRKAMGVKAGIPDYIVFIPRQDNNIVIWVEMKTKKGVQGKDQKEWEAQINKVNDSQYFLCRNADEAIDTVKEVYKQLNSKNN